MKCLQNKLLRNKKLKEFRNFRTNKLEKFLEKNACLKYVKL